MKCWDENPDNRPDAQFILEFFEKMIHEKTFPNQNPFELIALGDTTSFNIIIEIIDVNLRYPDQVYDGQYMKNATLLHFAARYGQLSIAEKLIQMNANINEKDNDVVIEFKKGLLFIMPLLAIIL